MINCKKSKTKRKILNGLVMLLNPFLVPVILMIILFILVCYITDIFYIGVKNEDESNMKEEVKYYTTSEYTEDETKSFFESVDNFISGIFKTEIMSDADWPVVGCKTITSYYGYRKAPTSGASTFHSGIDIAAPEGTKLVAIEDGTVTRTSWGGAGGFTITIKSGEYTYSYCHSDPNFIVEVGQEVKKGQVIRKSRTEKCIWCCRKSL